MGWPRFGNRSPIQTTLTEKQSFATQHRKTGLSRKIRIFPGNSPKSSWGSIPLPVSGSWWLVSKKSDPIESQRKNLSGSWHSGRSQHEQYLGHAGSSVRDLPHRRHSKIFTHEPLQRGSRSLQASKTSMRSFVSRYVQRHSTPAEIPT